MEDKLEKHRGFLVDRIDPDFGLLDKLLASRTLKREDLHRIKLQGITPEDKNRILLDFILKNKKANELVSALLDSGQTHLVNYLNADGGSGSAFGDDWPLSESEITPLEINREILVDLIDTSELCLRLFSEKVINKRQREFICTKPTDAEKNEALLDILTKSSLRQYKGTISCMKDCNQSHTAHVLSEGGVVVRVHANIEGDVGNTDEMEDEIISQLTKILENLPLDKVRRLLELTHQRVIAARKGHSVVIYFHCITYVELLQLNDLLTTKEMTRIMERVFAELLSTGDALTVTLGWSQEEFRRSAAYFHPGDVSLSRDMSTLTVANRRLSTVLAEESRLDYIKRWLSGQRSPRSSIKSTRLSIDSGHSSGYKSHSLKSTTSKGLPSSTLSDESEVSRPRSRLAAPEELPHWHSSERDKVKISKLETELSNERRKYADLEEERRRLQEENKVKIEEIEKELSNERRKYADLVKTHERLQEELGENKKTANHPQAQQEPQNESIQVLKKPLQQAECEIDKIRRNVYKLEIERDRYRYKKTENESYSDTEEKIAALTPSQGLPKQFSYERHESTMYLTPDSGCHGRKQILHRRESFAGVRSTPVSSNIEQKSATLRPSTNRQSSESKQYEEYLDDFHHENENRELKCRGTEKQKNTITTYTRSEAMVEQNLEKIEYREVPYLMKEIKTKASTDHSRAIHGLAILDEELFIISRVSSTVEVHDSRRLSLVRCIELKTLEAPWDIVACRINKCLYIMNWKEGNAKTMLRISSNGNVIKQWSTDRNYGRLSITQDSNIVLATYKTDTIIEYTSEGRLVREIKLSYKLAHPQHAIKLISGNFLIIHGMYDDKQQRVCLLDRKGHILKYFEGKIGSEIEQLGSPIYLAVDRAGSIFVVEYENSRVLLLSSSLQFMRVLLSNDEHGLRDPWSIHLDEANGRLFLVDNDYDECKKLLKDGRVLVFHVDCR